MQEQVMEYEKLGMEEMITIEVGSHHHVPFQNKIRDKQND
jgi:hypothetical protein